MNDIFEEIDGLPLQGYSPSMLGKFCEAFLEKNLVVTEKLFPLVESLLTSESFQSTVIRIYMDECLSEKLTIIQNSDARRDHPNAAKFYEPQLDLVEKKLSIRTFRELINSLNNHFNQYPGSLEIFNNFYKSIHKSDGSDYIRKNYTNYAISRLLYNRHKSVKNRADMLNMKYSEMVKSEYKKIGIDISREDAQFSKYKLLSLNENISIFNDKDNQAIRDSRIAKYFWIKIPSALLAKIEYLIEQEVIAEIAFRVDYVSDHLFAMEEMEFGSSLRLKISSLPEISKFYSTENYEDNLWIQHDPQKQSLTFEELVEDFEVADDGIVTQVIHLEYISRDENFFITHLDHEFIIYTLNQYQERTSNAGVKGYKKLKTFKIDKSMIPFNLKLGNDFFLIQVLDSYFKKNDLIQEYFAGIN